MKLDSLFDMFKNTNCAAALLTETWIKSGGNFDRIYDEITNIAMDLK